MKIAARFRGREMAHQEPGYNLLNRVKEDTGPIDTWPSPPACPEMHRAARNPADGALVPDEPY